MSSAPVEPRRWLTVKWLVAIVCLCAAQVLFVYLLEDRSPVEPRSTNGAPTLRLSGGPPGEWLALSDPTLFALPHLQAFSGRAWLTSTNLEFHPAEWSEPVRYLQLQTNILGVGFKTFLSGTAFPAFQAVVMPKPDLLMAKVDLVLPVNIRSTLRIEGALARRRLLSCPELPVWTNTDNVKLTTGTDFLTNSVVQLLVDARGNPVSAVLLPRATSGSDLADHLALDVAKATRFEPVKRGDVSAPTDQFAGLTIGTLLFEWQTMLASSTNTPAESP